MRKRLLSLLLMGILCVGTIGICAAGEEGSVTAVPEAGTERTEDTDAAASEEESMDDIRTETSLTASVNTVSAEGMEMDYTVFGSGEKTFVILPGLSIHSVMGSAQAVADAYQPFTDIYTVYVFDVVKNMPDDYSIKDMAEDTAAAMKALGIEKADLFGASQGGMISMCLGIDHPELVNKIILASTAAKPNDTFYRVMEKWEKLAEAKKEEELLGSFADTVYSEATLSAYRDYIISANLGVTEEEYRRFLIQVEALRSFDRYEELPQIQCPVLVLGSEGDKALTAEPSRQIAEALGCELYLYDENYGHGVYDEAPDYKQRCLDFLMK